jgi:hypothetical protein
MKISGVLLIMALVAPTNLGAQAIDPVSEDIHSDGNGNADVRGLTARTIVDLEAQIQARSDAEMLDRTPEYNAYAIGDRRVLTFTTAKNRAHPAVACRRAVVQVDGRSAIQTSLACFNSRENCDWLYREFESLTRRTIDEMDARQ